MRAFFFSFFCLWSLALFANGAEDLLRVDSSAFGIVETVVYRKHVSWKSGVANIGDYAKHFKTTPDFIQRSLSLNLGKKTVSEGDRFNVLGLHHSFYFHLLVDAQERVLFLYVIDEKSRRASQIKRYKVCLGRKDSQKASGLLTPLGLFTLGSRITAYGPGDMGTYKQKKIEMMTVFGTRWIPFEKELGMTTEPAKGFGIHGVPWERVEKNVIRENRSSLGKYESDGCVRMASEDVEELYAIITSRPSQIEIVRNFKDSVLKSN